MDAHIERVTGSRSGRDGVCCRSRHEGGREGDDGQRELSEKHGTRRESETVDGEGNERIW